MSTPDLPIETVQTSVAPGSEANNAGMKRAALRGSAITLISFGASTALRFGSNLIITRLLLPEHFGLMALVNVFITGLTLFSDIGVGPNIIQSKQGEDPVFLNTAWTVQVLRGVALWVLSCALAYPLAELYHQPALLWLLPIAGFGSVLGGLGSTKVYTLNRRLAFGRITLVDLISQIITVIVMIGIAWWSHSVWSLVVSGLVGAFAKMVLSHVLLPGHSNGFAWDPEARRSILTFGRWILASTAIFFLANQSDRLLLGRLVSADRLGLYAIAVNLAALPSLVIGSLASRVFYPVVAESMRQPDHDPATIRDSRIRLLAVVAPVIGMGIAMAPPVVTLLYRPDYHEVGLMTSALSLGSWLASISSSYGVVLLASGQPKYQTFGNAAKMALFSALIWFVSPRFGVLGVALLVSLSEIGLIVVSFIGCRRLQVITPGKDLLLTLFVLGFAALCHYVHHAVFVLTALRVPSICAAVALTALVCWGIAKRMKFL